MMLTIYIARICTFVFCLLSMSLVKAAPVSAEISAMEETVIALKSTGPSAKVILHPKEAGLNTRYDCAESRGVIEKETAYLNSVEIFVNKSALFVPRSVWIDLENPRQGTLRKSRTGFILTLSGCDGADAYFARIYFNEKGVHRKKLFSTLEPTRPTADTRYWLRELKDD